MCAFFFFSFFRIQPCIELRHPRTLLPEDVIRNTIGHLGHPIYVVNEVLFICHSLLTLHIYIKYPYKIYTIYMTYKIYNIYIRCIFFPFFRTQPGIEPEYPRPLYPDDVIRNPIIHVVSAIYVLNEVLIIYHSLLTLHIYAI